MISGGIGVGLDADNCVDLLRPGLPAEKAFKMGDKVLTWNGEALVEAKEGRMIQRKLKDVVVPVDEHTVVIERARKPWETSSWETTYEATKPFGGTAVLRNPDYNTQMPAQEDVSKEARHRELVHPRAFRDFLPMLVRQAGQDKPV